MEGATTPRNWSGALCLFICFALAVCTNHKQGKRVSQHQLERRPQVSRAQLFPPRGLWFPETDTTHKSLCPLCNTAATVVLGMGQKAGLLNIYLFVVQSADYPDWGNVMLGSKWKLCQIGKPGCRTRNSIYFAFSSKKKYVARLPGDGLQMH